MRRRYLKGRHTFKAGIVVEYSGQDDFDQINVQPIPGSTNNQNGRFQFTNARARPGRRSRTPRWARSPATPRSASAAETKYRSLATDLFVQDSWRPTDKLTVEGGVRWVYWPPWYSKENNIATFDAGRYILTNQAVIDPDNWSHRLGSPIQRHRAPWRWLRKYRDRPAAQRSRRCWRSFVGAPRGFAKTHKNVFEPRLGMAYTLNEKTILKVSGGIFHNRVTVSDSMFLGGNPPFQPQVGTSNGIADNPGGVGGAASLPLGMTAIDLNFKHPTAYMWSAGIQREIPLNFIVDVTYVGRRGRVPAARAGYQSGPARHRAGKSRREHRRASAV